MTRLAFGAILGLFVAYPALIAIVVGIIAAAVSQPVVLAAAAGYVLYPRLARALRWCAR